jgi:hypothetical protein
MAVVPIASSAPTIVAQTSMSLSVKVDNVVLAGAAKTVTVPVGCAYFYLFTTALLYLRRGGTATVPAADTQDGANDGSGSIPISAESSGKILYNTLGMSSFSVIGTAVVAVVWLRDHRSLT